VEQRCATAEAGQQQQQGQAGLPAGPGGAYHLNIDVFRRLMDTVSGWPGGKPGADDSR
jgi:glucosamine-6-phosphate deaminase